MEWLIFAGIVSLAFGVVLLSSRRVLLSLVTVLNKSLEFVDGKIKPFRIVLGIILVVIGGWVILVAFGYPGLWYLHPIGALILFFGLLYLFLPDWLEVSSKLSDRILLSTDEIIVGARKTFGILFIIIALYILYSAYLMLR